MAGFSWTTGTAEEGATGVGGGAGGGLFVGSGGMEGAAESLAGGRELMISGDDFCWGACLPSSFRQIKASAARMNTMMAHAFQALPCGGLGRATGLLDLGRGRDPGTGGGREVSGRSSMAPDTMGKPSPDGGDGNNGEAIFSVGGGEASPEDSSKLDETGAVAGWVLAGSAERLRGRPVAEGSCSVSSGR